MTNRVGIAALAAVSGSMLAFGVAGAQQPDLSNGFRSPSGNMTCVVADKGAVCEIGDHSYSAPAKPSNCYQASGDRIVLFQGDPARFTCHGDTIRDSSLPILDYGQSFRSGEVVCESQTSGMKCANTRTGHWFSLAREGYQLG
ncbi:hypothetical protein OG563_35320 [Nocardia vinacea]|uniref:Secreted protein n=1 Tax=Nocardia vinacea TaxID=96468 RepID=A0ABZ1YR50_9NOCA|nr:DUF6636 domain-containing protein [Nocardia vinacea]